jgi:hypothetical protein
MDTTSLLKSVGTGLGIGLSAAIGLTIVLLPVSWVMNRFIYHTGVMRLLLGFVTLCVSPIVFIGMVVLKFAGLIMNKEFLTKVPYGGLLPFKEGASGWLLWNPFLFEYNAEAVKGLFSHFMIPVSGQSEQIDGLTVRKGAVVEELFEASRAVGALTSYGEWADKMEQLKRTGLGAAVFSP